MCSGVLGTGSGAGDEEPADVVYMVAGIRAGTQGPAVPTYGEPAARAHSARWAILGHRPTRNTLLLANGPKQLADAAADKIVDID